MLAMLASPAMVAVVIEVAIPESPVLEKAIVAIALPKPSVTEEVVIESPIAIAIAIAQNYVSDPITARSASVQTTFACVMTVYKLGALAIMERPAAPTPTVSPAVSAALCE